MTLICITRAKILIKYGIFTLNNWKNNNNNNRKNKIIKQI